jgi:uncharacterized membrane protein YgcG
VNLDNVTRDDWIVGGLGIVLAICLIILPWFDFSVSVGAFSASASYSATSTPDGWLGILAFIAALAVAADLAIERLSPQTTIPSIGGSRTQTRFILALICAAFVVLKFLFHIHFSLFGWGFYVNVVLTAAFVYFAWQATTGQPVGFSAPSRPASPPPPPPAGSGGTTGAGAPGSGAGGAAGGAAGGGAVGGGAAGGGAAGGGAAGGSTEPPAAPGGSTPPPGA